METVLNITMITVIITFILDVSGFADTIRRFFTALGKRTPKVMVCSLCASWWLSLIYLVITNAFKLQFICLALIIANTTSLISGLWWLIYDTINALIVALSRRINNFN